MKKITEEEAFELLEEQGWNPMPCDTPVPFYDVPVPCGYPTEVGEAMGDYGMLPGELLMAMDGFILVRMTTACSVFVMFTRPFCLKGVVLVIR